MVQTSMYLPREVVEWLDSLKEQAAKNNPGMRVSRGDIARQCLERARSVMTTEAQD